MLAQFYSFVIARYQGDIHALTGRQPIDEFNKPSSALAGRVRVPPSEEEVDELFAKWRSALPGARKYLPAARDCFAASLWRRVGLRINETAMLDVRDWRPDLGGLGSCISGSARALEVSAGKDVGVVDRHPEHGPPR